MSQMHHSTDRLEFDMLDRLAKSLRVSGMKPGDMAEALDVHRNTISNYLHGKTPIDRRTLIAWAFACAPEVTVDWLEHGELPKGAPTPPDDGEALRKLTASKARNRRIGRDTPNGNTPRYARLSAAA